MIKTAIKRSTISGSPLTILGILKGAEEELKAHGIQNPRLDSEALLSKTIGLNRAGLYSEYDRILTEKEISRFLGLARRRIKREPLQYILGSTEFYGLEFLVTPDALIPRPETELLVEEALRIVTGLRFKVTSENRKSSLNILDLCTGSGCIALTLAKKLKIAKIYAVDISASALKLARENARRHKIEERINFIHGDLFEPFTVHSSRLTVHNSQFDLIVSNPPYIPRSEIDSLQKEVGDYEPRDALDGGADGLFYIRKIIKDASLYLRSGGALLLEIGYGQKDEVLRIASEQGAYGNPEAIKDFAGIDRVVKFRRV